MRPVIKKFSENQTFDDLFDWRLRQVDIFMGKELKANISLYHPNNRENANPLVIAGKDLKEKPLSPTLFNIEEIDDYEDDVEDGAATSKAINKSDIKDLVNFINMKPEEIIKAQKRKQGKKRDGNIKITQVSPTINSKFLDQRQIAVEDEIEERRGDAKRREDGNKTRLYEDPDDEFEISDDEAHKKRSVAVQLDNNPEKLKAFNSAKNVFRAVIQQRKKNNTLKANTNLDDLRYDEDFKRIGEVTFEHNDFAPSTMANAISNVLDLKQVNASTRPIINLMDAVSPTKDREKDKDIKNEDKEPNTKDKEGDNHAKRTTKHDKSPTIKGVDKESPDALLSPVKISPDMDKEVANLLLNPAFNPIKKVMLNKNSMNKMNKAKNNKKKKRKDDNEDEITPEMIEEEKIIKYYQGKQYDFLKLEVKFMYGAIPQPVFNSILDIVPGSIKDKKMSKISDQSKEQTKETLNLIYSNVELNKFKQEKKKGKKDEKKKKLSAELNQSSGAGSGGISSDSFDDSLGESTVNEDDLFLHQKDKASEAKINRRMLLATNEKYIVRKPFPLNDSERADEMMKNLQKEAVNIHSKSNQVSNSRKEKAKKGEAVEEIQALQDFIKNTKNEDDKDWESLRKKDNHYDYKNLYMDIRTSDTKEREIGRFNWSGNQIMKPINFTLSQTEKTIYSLNVQKLEMWMMGYKGVVATTQRYCREFIESSPINILILSSVFLNTLMMAMDGLTPASWTDMLNLVNNIFTGIFAAEMVIKIYGWGIRGYSRDPFNLFDFFVVALSMVEVGINATSDGGGAPTAFRAVRIFRIFRVLRVTRLLRTLKFMKVIIEVVKGTLEQFAYIALLMFLFVFIFTLLGTQVFGGNFNFTKDGEIIRYNFDDFETAFYTSFMILTIENWNEIIMNCLRSDTNSIITVVYFIAWIFIGNYIFLNLFLAILLDGFENSENLQMVDEIEQENKEHERIHRALLKNYEEKKKNEIEEEEKATKKVMILIDPESLRARAEISKKQACYEVVREEDLDNETLSEDLEIYNHLSERFTAHTVKIDPWVGSNCNKALFYFTKANPIRKFCATVVSQSYFESIILVLIILTSMKLVVETYLDTDKLDEGSNAALDWVDRFFNVCFTFECIMKIMKFGFFVPEGAYLKDPWSILDFIIVITSLIDMAVESVNLPILKVLRLLRTLRPLRFISKNQNMRVVVNSLLESMIAILNVLVVIGMVWVMFAILGNNLMKGKMGYCDEVNAADHPNFTRFNVSKVECLQKFGGVWKNAYWNFDDIGQSLVTLYSISTLEGWPRMFFSARDANDDTNGPTMNNSTTNALFFIVFILIGSIFFMNMFVGVICVQFSEEQRKEKAKRFHMVTDEQMRWMLVTELISTAKPNFDVMIRPKGKVRIFFFRMIRSKIFESIIMVFIILNIASMAMVYETMTDDFRDIMSSVNLAFSVVFLAEMICKLIALDFQYFSNTWNNFDFTIVILSIVDIVMDNLGSSIGFLKTAPQFARVLRVLRVTRLFKLMKVKQLEGINKIIKTLLFSFPSLMNVLVLLFLIYFIFAVLACFLFRGITVANTNFQNNLWGFPNFHIAFMTLFRCSTGEDWPMFMYLYGDTGSIQDALVSRAFFIIYIFLSATVMLQVFQLVVMEQFDEFYFNPDNAINSFDEITDIFDTTWNQFTIKYSGNKIKASRLVEFFYYLEEPLGYRKKEESEDDEIVEILASKERKRKVGTTKNRYQIAFDINSWKIHMDSYIYVPYRFVLHAAIANALGNKSLMFSSYEAYKTVKVKEMQLAADILISLTKKVKSKKPEMQDHVLNISSMYVNSLKQFLHLRLALKSWIR